MAMRNSRLTFALSWFCLQKNRDITKLNRSITMMTAMFKAQIRQLYSEPSDCE